MALYMRHGTLVEQREWTGAELTEARALRRNCFSAAQIGRILGRSRNSVIGALHRAAEPGVLVTEHRSFSRPARSIASPPRAFSWESQDVQT